MFSKAGAYPLRAWLYIVCVRQADKRLFINLRRKRVRGADRGHFLSSMDSEWEVEYVGPQRKLERQGTGPCSRAKVPSVYDFSQRRIRAKIVGEMTAEEMVKARQITRKSYLRRKARWQEEPRESAAFLNTRLLQHLISMERARVKLREELDSLRQEMQDLVFSVCLRVQAGDARVCACVLNCIAPDLPDLSWVPDQAL